MKKTNNHIKNFFQEINMVSKKIDKDQISKLVNSRTKFGKFTFIIENPKEAFITDSTSEETIINFLEEIQK